MLHAMGSYKKKKINWILCSILPKQKIKSQTTVLYIRRVARYILGCGYSAERLTWHLLYVLYSR